MAIENEDRVDFNQNEALNLRLQQLGADPSTAVEGQIWYRSDLHKARVDDGTNSRSLRYEEDNQFDASTASGNGPLTILTDGVGTDTALVIRASTSTANYLQVDVATTTPKMSFTQAGTQVTIEPTTIHAHSGYDVVNVTPPLVQVYNNNPTTPSVVEITAYDVTLNGVSAFDGASSPERSTGLLTWTGVKLVKVDATHIGVGALTGVIVDTAGTITNVSYAGTASVLDAYVGTTFNTYFTIDSTATLIQRSTHPTPQQAREEIFLGYSVHAPVGTITVVTATPDISFNTMSQVRDVINDGMGIVNKGIRPQANGANLQLNMLGGYLYSMGINFVNNALDPARLQFTALTPATFQYRTQTGAATGNLTLMEVGYWDVAGTRTLISGTKYCTHRVYVSPAGLVRLQYGQVLYNSMATALAALPGESFVTYSAFQQNLVLVGSITVRSNATVLNTLAQAVFTPASIFGELVVGGGGTSTTTLQGAYSNSTEPEITLDATLGALSIKSYSGGDATNSLEILEDGGTTTASITGEGIITGTSYDVVQPAGSLGTISFIPPSDTAGNDLKQFVQWLNAAETTRKALVGYRAGTVGEGLRVVSIGTSVPATPMVRIGVHGDASTPDEGGVFQIGAYSGDYAGLWAGEVTPATSNYALRAGISATVVNVPGTADNISFRSADANMVVFNRDVPTNVGAASSAYGMYIGGYNATSCALWNAGRIPTQQNYGFWLGDTQTEVNAPTGGEVLIGVNNVTKWTTTSTAHTSTIPLILPTSTATKAGLNIGAFGVVPSAPVDGDIYKSAADTLVARMSTNTRTLPFLEKAQTFSGIQTFSASPVISSTTAATTTGVLYRKASYGLVNYELGPKLLVGTVFRGATGTTLTNSTTETDISTTAAWGTATLPANILQAGTQVRIRLMVNVTNSSVANSLIIRIKIGGQIVWAFTSTTHITSPHAFDVIAYTAAAPSASSSVMAGGYCDSFFASGTGSVPVNLATNTALAVTATLDWASANASSATGYIAGIDIM